MAGKLLSRRVVLGTVATGLAVPPLAVSLNALFGSSEKRRGSTEYENEWETCVKTLDVPIKKTEGPAKFTLEYDVRPGTEFRVLSVATDYSARRSPYKYPNLPPKFSYRDGRVVAVKLPSTVTVWQGKTSSRVQYNKRPVLRIDAKLEAYQKGYPHLMNRGPHGCELAIPRNDGEDCAVDYVHEEDVSGKLVERPYWKVCEPCVDIAMAMASPCPKGQSLAKGAKWTIPEMVNHGFELPCEVVGFATVAGKETVEMLTERHLDATEFQHMTIYRRQEQQPAAKGQGKPVSSDEALRKTLAELTAKQITMTIQHRHYVDMKTGLCIRLETRRTICSPTPDVTHMAITQVLES